jgi:excisionase family DNA binding protein
MADWMNVSKPTVSMYIKLGMPAAPLGNRWHFYKDHVNEWFKKKTYSTWKGNKEPEEMEEGA